MSFRITGLDPARFAHLFAMSDAELAGQRALRLSREGCSRYGRSAPKA